MVIDLLYLIIELYGKGGFAVLTITKFTMWHFTVSMKTALKNLSPMTFNHVFTQKVLVNAVKTHSKDKSS